MSANQERQPDERDAVAYIGDMSSALAQLARQHNLAALSYLLQLAQMEAEIGTEASAATGGPAPNAPSTAEPASPSSANRVRQSAELQK
jgi:hypothetical protein